MNLEKRVNLLEKTVKFQRLGLFTLVGCFSIFLLVGATKDKLQGEASFGTISCHELLIVNEEGKQMIVAGIEGLSIMDDKSVPRIAMGMNPENRDFGLAMMDQNGVPRIAAGTNTKGEAGISLIAAGIVEVMSQKTWPAK